MRKTSLGRFLAIGAGIAVSSILSSSVSGQFNQTSSRPHGALGYVHPESGKQKSGGSVSGARTHVIGVTVPENISGSWGRSGGYSFNPQTSGLHFETPASLACVYGLVGQTTGCSPAAVTAVVSGGGTTPTAIAIVGAYDNPYVQQDLATFANTFGLPAPRFQVVWAGRKPQTDTTGWSLKSSLDVEWAFAMSPYAQIYLVEAASNQTKDLLAAIDLATQKVVAATNGGVVSMSWGAAEISNEISQYDSHFQTSGVTYLASAGDSAGTEWPSVSTNVISVGGTSISRDPTGTYILERAWQQTGGGMSAYVSKPAYQSSLPGTNRAVPDIAADANPATGVWVYSQWACYLFGYGSCLNNWIPVGGTSVAAPVEAGILSQKAVKTSTQATLQAIYGNSNPYNSSNPILRDIQAGDCGLYDDYLVGSGWDFCTGLGSLLGTQAGTQTSVASLRR